MLLVEHLWDTDAVDERSWEAARLRDGAAAGASWPQGNVVSAVQRQLAGESGYRVSAAKVQGAPS
jgi:hypothetical protein